MKYTAIIVSMIVAACLLGSDWRGQPEPRDLIEQSFEWSGTTSVVADTFTFDQFPPEKGELTDVYVVFYAEAGASPLFQNRDPDNAHVAACVITSNHHEFEGVWLQYGPWDLPGHYYENLYESPDPVPPMGFYQFGYCSTALDVLIGHGTNPWFIGTGTFDMEFLSDCTIAGDNSPGDFWVTDFAQFGTLKVIYEYIPAPAELASAP